MSEVRHETTLHLLFLKDEQAALQTLTTDQTSYFGANVAEAAGLGARLLRRVYFKYDGEVAGVHRTESVWHMENVNMSGLNWQPVTALSETVQAWVKTAQHPPSNVPWMREGWFTAALDWVDTELAAQGWLRKGEPKVLKHGQISALWQVGTTHGKVYFKAVPDFFRREVELTPLLARELTGAAPPVLAADLDRGFLLLGDAGAEVSESPDLNAIMRHWGRLQRESVPLVSAWKLRDRGPEYVLSWLEVLLSDQCLLVDGEVCFTPVEAAQLRSKRPELQAALQRLAQSTIPRTLGHGDLHGGNMTKQGGEYTVLDWSDVCLTHPFLDVNPAYFYPWQVDPPPEAVAQARDIYLKEWTAFAPLGELQSLFKDGRLVGELFRALGYVDGLQGAVEDKTEWQFAHVHHLRRILHLSQADSWQWTP